MIKLLMTWDLKPGHEPEYVEFIMREFGPAMVKMGLQPTDAWYTVYGEGPQVLAGGVTKLEAELFTHVEHYRRRIVEATGGFQL